MAAQRAPAIAAAANLNFALTEIAERFARDRGTRVEVVFGASGTLARQIQDGAPFEMFLAADEEFPQRAGRCRADPRSRAWCTRLAAWCIFAPTGSPLTVDERLDGLAQAGEGRTGEPIRDRQPDVAPYGRAAEAVLRKRGLWDAIRPQLVLGDTIAQAAQFATTGNAVGGLIAYSLVLGPGFADRGTYAVIPERDHPPLRQRMVLLKQASPTVDAVLRLPAERRGARDSPESTATECHSSRPWTGRRSVSRSGWARARSRSCCRSASGSGGCWRFATSGASCCVEALVTVPLVLPPTVLGFYLLVTFGARSPLGQAFQALVGQSLPFSFEGLLVASAIANIPFVVQPIQRGFEAIPRDVRDAAACCGLTPWQRFLRIEVAARLARHSDRARS